MEDCLICCETFNKTDKRKITCGWCEYSSCLKCQKRYLLSSIQDLHCMNCKKKWNRKFLSTQFPQSFLQQEYRAHRENLLFEREKALLPATQVHIPVILRRKGLNRMSEMVREETDLLFSLDPSEERELRLSELQHLHSLIAWKVRHLSDRKEEETRQKFTMKCPVADCRGFLSSRYKCGVCNGRVCPDCHIELKEEKHDCEPDLVKTVEELKKTTKNCPNCHVPIFKSSGCDQMWCVNCHVAFNWKTGEIEKGVIHNPEYFEFMRRMGTQARNPHEQVCGGLPDFRTVNFYARTRAESDFLQHYYQQLAHLRNDTMRRLPTPMDNQSNLNLRISYLMKEITDEEFKTTLRQKETELEKKLEHRQILDTYVSVGEEMLRQVAGRHITLAFLATQLKQLLPIVNDQLEELNRVFKSKIGWIILPKQCDIYMKTIE